MGKVLCLMQICICWLRAQNLFYILTINVFIFLFHTPLSTTQNRFRNYIFCGRIGSMPHITQTFYRTLHSTMLHVAWVILFYLKNNFKTLFEKILLCLIQYMRVELLLLRYSDTVLHGNTYTGLHRIASLHVTSSQFYGTKSCIFRREQL